jgi:hypothetical protein
MNIALTEQQIENRRKMKAFAELVRLDPSRYSIRMEPYHHDNNVLIIELRDEEGSNYITPVFIKNPYRS